MYWDDFGTSNATLEARRRESGKDLLKEGKC
jgi:hypothetical protein